MENFGFKYEDILLQVSNNTANNIEVTLFGTGNVANTTGSLTFGNVGIQNAFYNLLVNGTLLNSSPIHIVTPNVYPACAIIAAGAVFAALDNTNFTYTLSGQEVIVTSNDISYINGATLTFQYVSGSVVAPTTITNLSTGLTISTANSQLSYTQLVGSLYSLSYKFNWIYMNGPNIGQISVPMNYNIYNADGTFNSNAINYPVDPNQFQPAIYWNVRKDNLVITNLTTLSFTLYANSFLQFEFYGYSTSSTYPITGGKLRS